MSRYTFTIVLVLLSRSIYAQQQKPLQASGEPIDFMTIVIEGKGTLSLPKSVLKQSPQPPPPYQQFELDSINTLEKVPLFRSDVIEYPVQILPQSPYRSLIEALAGLYGFASLSGQHWITFDDVLLDLQGKLDYGGPYLPNADYLQMHFTAHAQAAQQNAPDASSMQTEAKFDVGYQSWKQFADLTAPRRSLRQIGLLLSQRSSMNDIPYTATLDLRGIRLTHTDTVLTDESGVRLNASTYPMRLQQFELGGSMELWYRNYQGSPLHFHTITGTLTLSDSTIGIAAWLGSQVATSSWKEMFVSPLLRIECNYQFLPLWRLHATLMSGQEPVTFNHSLEQCPYIISNTAIGVRRISYHLASGIAHSPSREALIDLTAGLISFHSAPYFNPQSDASFSLEYAAYNERFISLRTHWNAGRRGTIAFKLSLRDVRFDTGVRVPYQPLVQATAEYGRVIADKLVMTMRIGYVSARQASLINSDQLPAYLVLAGRLEYQITPTISVISTLDNLLGSSIVLWRGYRERGSFVSLGAIVRL